MKIVVMGAGAVGGYYGALLARAGHAVTLIGRAAHVDAIAQAGGLWLHTDAGEACIPLQASTEPSAVRGAQWVLFCVKSTDTDSAGHAIAPHLDAGAVLLSLQNGVDNAKRLQAIVGAQHTVLPSVVYVASAMTAPGHVRHLGRGELVLAQSVVSAAIATAFRSAGIATEVSDNVAAALWTKLVLNCVYNPLSAISQLPYGAIVGCAGLEGGQVTQVMADIVRECQAVAQARGVVLPADILATTLALAHAMPQQHSSTAQDLARGKRSEIDHLNGFIVCQGAALGVATPVNRLLHTLVRLLEAAPTPLR